MKNLKSLIVLRVLISSSTIDNTILKTLIATTYVASGLFLFKYAGKSK